MRWLNGFVTAARHGLVRLIAPNLWRDSIKTRALLEKTDQMQPRLDDMARRFAYYHLTFDKIKRESQNLPTAVVLLDWFVASANHNYKDFPNAQHDAEIEALIQKLRAAEQMR